MPDDALSMLRSARAFRDDGDHGAAVRAFDHALLMTEKLATHDEASPQCGWAALRAEVAREYAAALIGARDDLNRIYDLLNLERVALESVHGEEPSIGVLARRYSEFTASVASSDKPRAEHAAAALLAALFGHAGPDAAFAARIALVRNLLVRARLIADREDDAEDALAVAETALEDALDLGGRYRHGGAFLHAYVLVREAVDTVASISGHPPTWWGRTKTVGTYLPITPNPRSARLIDIDRIALLLLALGAREDDERAPATPP